MELIAILTFKCLDQSLLLLKRLSCVTLWEISLHYYIILLSKRKPQCLNVRNAWVLNWHYHARSKSISQISVVTKCNSVGVGGWGCVNFFNRKMASTCDFISLCLKSGRRKDWYQLAFLNISGCERLRLWSKNRHVLETELNFVQNKIWVLCILSHFNFWSQALIRGTYAREQYRE